MIAFLQGRLLDFTEETVIVDVHGVGFELQVHQRLLSQLPAQGSQITLFTHMQVLENEMKLYGFSSADELKMFKILLTVSGIGARVAISILGVLDPAALARAIASGDEKTLVTVPGVGKKTAQRLVFELRDKISQQSFPVEKGAELDTAAASMPEDVLAALETLGYSRSEVFPMVMDMQARGEFSPRVEENIKNVLKRIAAEMKR